jgi:hypothetical protein
VVFLGVFKKDRNSASIKPRAVPSRYFMFCNSPVTLRSKLCGLINRQRREISTNTAASKSRHRTRRTQFLSFYTHAKPRMTVIIRLWSHLWRSLKSNNEQTISVENWFRHATRYVHAQVGMDPHRHWIWEKVADMLT